MSDLPVEDRPEGRERLSPEERERAAASASAEHRARIIAALAEARDVQTRALCGLADEREIDAAWRTLADVGEWNRRHPEDPIA